MKKVLFIMFFLLSIFCVNASSIDYTIIDNKVLVEMNIDSVNNFELKLPYDYRALEVNKNYGLNNGILKIPKADNLTINYITQSLIEKSTNKYFFIIKGSDSIVFNKINLKLPEGAVLEEDYVIFPKDYKLNTNGRNIILTWSNISNSEILVSYEKLRENSIYFYLIISLLVILMIYLFKEKNIKLKKQKKQNKKETQDSKQKKVSNKEKLKKSLTRNLFEDEKRIIEYLINKKNNECWTKEIVKDLNISRVKLSRKLRSLSQKELIKKIPFGNENRIRLIKNK